MATRTKSKKQPETTKAFDWKALAINVSIGTGLIVLVGSILCGWATFLVKFLAVRWKNELSPRTVNTITLEELGQVGDLFGGANALFAALAFIGVAIAAYYQRQTFEQQKRDSVQAAEALQLSNDANTAQLVLSHQEQFENLFFRVLAEAQRQLDGLKLITVDEEDSDNMSEQQETAFVYYQIEQMLSKLFVDYIADQPRAAVKENTDSVRLKVEEFYAAVYSRNRYVLAPLFRTLYQLFDIISRSKLNYEQQCNYSKIMRASLNENLVRLLMLNGLSKPGLNFKPLIEKYGLLKHISADPYEYPMINKLAALLYGNCAFEEFSYRSCCYDAEKGYKLPKRSRMENLDALNHYEAMREANAENEEDDD
jgi:hypothetical protein